MLSLYVMGNITENIKTFDQPAKETAFKVALEEIVDEFIAGEDGVLTEFGLGSSQFRRESLLASTMENAGKGKLMTARKLWEALSACKRGVKVLLSHWVEPTSRSGWNVYTSLDDTLKKFYDSNEGEQSADENPESGAAESQDEEEETEDARRHRIDNLYKEAKCPS